ncbi:MAG: acetylhydrolase, partial [Chitinophagaceae bacterium]
MQGNGWPEQIKGSYQRLPLSMKTLVRPPVWALALNTAGEFIEFTTNAKNISVRYGVTGAFNMPHMPSTGVSGTDLYTFNNGKWEWMPGKFSFKDTVTYNFNNINASVSKLYRLYLPLYNGVKWLQVGVARDASLAFAAAQPSRPVVVYGTSIAQGGCASRPGLGWTAILERSLNIPVINLGFSGNGRLEAPILNAMTEIDARAYILDCIPNLGDSISYPDAEVRKRIIDAVAILRKVRPAVPILLTEMEIGI